MKPALYLATGILVIILGFFLLNSYIYNEKQAPAFEDYKTAYFVIDGERVTLGEGTATYFGNEIRADLDQDGAEDDYAFIITNEPGGSGTFYYAVGAVHTERGYVGTEAYFLGDRIAPQPTTGSENPAHRGVVAFHFADRAAGEPMTTAPSIGKEVLLKLDPVSLQWGIVEPNFEGEAAPEAMTLQMHSWTWVSALYIDGTMLAPNTVGDFVLTFGENDRFSVKTDCNSMAGTYEAIEGAITFSDVAMTQMYCEGSMESDFARLIEGAAEYSFTRKGELILGLKFDSGTATFR